MVANDLSTVNDNILHTVDLVKKKKRKEGVTYIAVASEMTA